MITYTVNESNYYKNNEELLNSLGKSGHCWTMWTYLINNNNFRCYFSLATKCYVSMVTFYLYPKSMTLTISDIGYFLTEMLFIKELWNLIGYGHLLINTLKFCVKLWKITFTYDWITWSLLEGHTPRPTKYTCSKFRQV